LNECDFNDVNGLFEKANSFCGSSPRKFAQNRYEKSVPIIRKYAKFGSDLPIFPMFSK